MDCRTFQRSMLEGAGTPALAAHLESCRHCRELSALVHAEGSAPLVEPPAELPRLILQATTGPVCDRIAERLCELAAGPIEACEQELLQGHVDHCPSCTVLLGELTSLPEELARWSEVLPDARFVEDVLTATSRGRKRKPRDARTSLNAWQRFLLRPRLAWELGFVGAMLVWAALGVTGTARGSGSVAPPAMSDTAVACDDLRTGVARHGLRLWERSARAWSSVVARADVRFEQFQRSTAEPGRARARALLHELAADVRGVGKQFVETLDNPQGGTHEPEP